MSQPSSAEQSPVSTPAPSTAATTPAAPDEAARPWWKHPFCMWTRRAAGFGLLLYGAYLLVWGEVARVCRQELADNSTAVTVCAPMDATDPRALVWLLVVLVIFLPDLAEIELGGVLKLRRAVEETKEEAQELRAELADIRTSAASSSDASSQSGALIINQLGTELVRRGVGEFLLDTKYGDGGAFSPEEERGAYAQLAFNAAMTGLLPQLFSRWEEENLNLYGYVLSDEGTFDLTYFVPDAVPADMDDIIVAELNILDAGDGVTLLIPGPVGYTVIAYAFSDPDLKGRRHLLGAFAANYDDGVDRSSGIDSDDPGAGLDPEEVSAMRTATATAAAVYGLMLTKLLGERPTLWGLAAAGGDSHG